MPFETLKRSHLKRNILIGVVVIAIISAVVLQFTRAKYIFTDKMPLINGTVNYSPYDITVTSKLLVGEDTTIDLEEIPTSSNVSLVSATCTNDAVLTWNASENGYEVSNLTHKGTKCEAIYGMANEGDSTDFDYTGNIQEFTAPSDGYYLLEVWGAQGGDAYNSTGGTRIGGYGGYSKGTVYLNEGETLYVAVGGAGIDGISTSTQTGGYNGGGSGLYHGGSGGGATHIATASGLLSTLSGNQDSILIVAGGGGGAAVTNSGNCSDGGNGGGISGNDSTTNACSDTNSSQNGYGTGGTQTEGGTQSANGSSNHGSGSVGEFGNGATSTLDDSSFGAGGGGGGLYGGGSSTLAGAGGGSGYIGNSKLESYGVIKNMYCYNCKESSSSNTLTYSTTSVSVTPTRDTAKEGNGYARITPIISGAYQPIHTTTAEENNGNITVTITPNADNLFATSKYYFSINNNDYIESDSNTYTFESLDVGEYEIKTYIVDEKGLESEIETQSISITEGITIADIINSHNISTRTDFSTPLTSNTTGTIYRAEDDDGTTYYFVGAVDDNWVSFAGFYWRIVRINGDGTIRLIYQGTSAQTTGSGTQISTSAFASSYNDNTYVGYMYTRGNVHGLGTSSTIKGVLDNWYLTNIQNAGYSSYIDTNAGFCGDRSPSTSTSSSNGLGGTYTTVTFYGAYIRYSNNGTPTFRCSNGSDLYTVGGSNKGNKALTYPIGLITMDEVWYAGGNRSENSSYYLYTNQHYWTMSPYTYLLNSANVFLVYSSGILADNYSVTHAFGVRPVINLKSNTIFEAGGMGTSSNPYVVKGAS